MLAAAGRTATTARCCIAAWTRWADQRCPGAPWATAAAARRQARPAACRPRPGANCARSSTTRSTASMATSSRSSSRTWRRAQRRGFHQQGLEDARQLPPPAPGAFVTCSVGRVGVPLTDGMDPDLLIRNAGLALRHAKQAAPHRYEFFSPRFNERALSRLDLERGAAPRDQPRRDRTAVRAARGARQAPAAWAQIVLRWKHASGRIIEGDEPDGPGWQSEMDVALTEWVFEQMRKHVKNWRRGRPAAGAHGDQGLAGRTCGPAT